MKINQCKFLMLFFVAFIARANPPFSPGCFEAETYVRLAGANQGKQAVPSTHLSASVMNLKALNTMFENKTGITEAIVNMYHFLFYRNLRHELMVPKLGASQANSVLLKTLDFFVLTPGLERKGALTEAILKAKEKSTATLRSLFEHPEKHVDDLDLAYSSDPLRNRIIGISFQGSMSIEPFTNSELTRTVIPLIKNAYPNIGDFVQWVSKNYVVGLGHSKASAFFASRGAFEAGESVGYFDFREMFHRIQTGVDLRKVLSPLFGKLSADELDVFFSILRKNFENNGENFSNQYRDKLKDYASTLNMSGTDAHQLFVKYLSALRFFDYIHTEWIQSNSKKRDAFDSLVGDGMVLFLDVKNLGARNYREIHSRFSKFHLWSKLIRQKAMERELETDAAKIQHLEDQLTYYLGELEMLHEQVLKPSDNFLKTIVSEIDATLNGFGAQKVKFAIWDSGDDIFVKLILKDETPQTILRGIVQNQQITPYVRIGFMNIRSKVEVPLTLARMQVGETASVLKDIEESGPQSRPYVIEFKGDGQFLRHDY